MLCGKTDVFFTPSSLSSRAVRGWVGVGVCTYVWLRIVRTELKLMGIIINLETSNKFEPTVRGWWEYINTWGLNKSSL